MLSWAKSNASKSNYFPVRGERADVDMDFIESSGMEKSYLIDCRVDNPGKHLFFKEDGFVDGVSERGAITIDILNLNRKDLVHKRSLHVTKIKEYIDHYFDSSEKEREKIVSLLISLMLDNMVFAGVSRQILIPFFLDQKIKFAKRVPFDYSVYKERSKTNFNKSSARKITWLKVENFLGVESVEINFDKHESLVILGPNGVGKSSLLKAICFIAMTDVQKKNFLKKHLSFFSGKRSRVQAKFDHHENVLDIEINGYRKFTVTGPKVKPLLLGFGPYRITKDSGKISKPKIQSFQSVLSPHFKFQSPESWIADERNVDKIQFANIATSLGEIIGQSPDMISRNFEDLIVNYKNKRVSYKQMSDGFRNLTSIALNILYNFIDSTSDIKKISAIVLIDEIENHLHPVWKREIYLRLKSVFPNIQFIITTHDPLVVTTAEDANIVVLSSDDKDYAQSLDDTTGKTSDQILLGEGFRLFSTYSPSIEKKYDEYVSELNINSESEKCSSLEDELREIFGNFAETPFEKIAHKLMGQIVREEFYLKKRAERNKDIKDIRAKLKSFE